MVIHKTILNSKTFKFTKDELRSNSLSFNCKKNLKLLKSRFNYGKFIFESYIEKLWSIKHEKQLRNSIGGNFIDGCLPNNFSST